MMKPRRATLGESIFNKIETNEYLQELYKTILYNYSMTLLGHEQRKKPLRKDHALRFADVLSKSYGHKNSERHRAWAQEIVALLNSIYPDDAKIKAYASSVLTSIGNYRGLQLIKTKYKTTSFLDELYTCFDMDYLAIPFQENKYFFHSQKEIFDHLEDSAFSYSGPTSAGKSLMMRMFIKSKIHNSSKVNFAILVPTKALISEISTELINKDLKEDLKTYSYKVVTSGNSLFLKQNDLNYIMVMTPERLLYTLITYPDLIINYVFIDEAHKINDYDGRSTFYFKVSDMLVQRNDNTHIILASPNIPSPNDLLRVLPLEKLKNSYHLKTSFTPVSQMKYVLNTIKNEFLVVNERTPNKNTYEKVFDLDPSDTTIDLIKKIVSKDPAKSNIVYCSGRSKAVGLAREFAEPLSLLNDEKLDKLAQEIRDDIHSDYYLADLIEKGVAYHVGYLPLHIRFKIEELYRKRIIKTIFCTPTLIEGVNLPADNLIVVSCRLGKKGNMNQIEFKNLIGRAGRIEYNLYGNIFIVRDKLIADKTLDKLLSREIDEPKNALLDNMPIQYKEYIVNKLIQGSTQFMIREGQDEEKYDMMRKTGLILLKDILNDRNSVIRQSFSSLLDNDKISKIKQLFNSTQRKAKADDDINVSVDQTESLIDAINEGLRYPNLNDKKRVDYYVLKAFLYKLSKVFKWDIYERETLGYGNKIDYYSVVLANWINGHGLSLLLSNTLKYNQENHQKIIIDRKEVFYNGSQEHKNIVIGDTLQIIENIILFKIANYFLRFSTEYKKLKTNGQPFDNDWYEYVEYGSTNELTIFFQRNGLTRDTSDYIRSHHEYLAIINGEYKLHRNILNCPKASVSEELSELQFNIPELFVD